MAESVKGQNAPASVIHTASVQRTYWAPPRPMAHGRRPNTMALDLKLVGLDDRFILDSVAEAREVDGSKGYQLSGR